MGCADGDTISVLQPGSPPREVRVRLWQVDAPELHGQAFGQASKAFASKAVFGQTVRVVEHGTDRYGRTLGEVFYGQNRNLNEDLVAAGYAWVYLQYCVRCDALIALEQVARKEKRGLWQDPHAEAPWLWRKEHR